MTPAPAARGAFITLEGPEGAGKTTQIRPLAERLSAAGRRVLATREPGGTPAGEAIRRLLLEPRDEVLRPETEALLFCAARSELVQTVIRPALAAGHVVLCDRFADATLAYQGHGRGLPRAALDAANRLATGGLAPDLTLLLDVDVAHGLQRRRGSGGEWNRFDADGEAFHRRVRAGYLELARADPERWVIVDAGRPIDAVASDVWRAVAARLALPAPAAVP